MSPQTYKIATVFVIPMIGGLALNYLYYSYFRPSLLFDLFRKKFEEPRKLFASRISDPNSYEYLSLLLFGFLVSLRITLFFDETYLKLKILSTIGIPISLIFWLLFFVKNQKEYFITEDLFIFRDYPKNILKEISWHDIQQISTGKISGQDLSGILISLKNGEKLTLNLAAEQQYGFMKSLNLQLQNHQKSQKKIH